MAQTGAITGTQYRSAFDSKGNLTAEAKNDLQKVLYQVVFKGGSQQLEEMFDKLPAKAQRAILSTAFRDMDSPFTGRLLPELHASIVAYNELMKKEMEEKEAKYADMDKEVEAAANIEYTEEDSETEEAGEPTPAYNPEKAVNLRIVMKHKMAKQSATTRPTPKPTPYPNPKTEQLIAGPDEQEYNGRKIPPLQPPTLVD